MIRYVLRQAFAMWFTLIGSFWTLTEIVNFVNVDLGTAIKDNFWWLVGFSVLVAILNQYRVLTIKHKVDGADVEVEIRFGNLLSQKGNKVVGVNTNFDTSLSPEHVHPESLHGQFIEKFYKSQIPKLDRELSAALGSAPCSSGVGSPGGKDKRYGIGQVVQLDLSGDIYYLLAYSNFSNNWKAESSKDWLKNSIASLWNHIYDNPGNMGAICVPVFGTNFARLGVTRADVIKETIRSFLVISRSKKITHRLSIVVRWSDFRHVSDAWIQLDDFVRYECSK